MCSLAFPTGMLVYGAYIVRTSPIRTRIARRAIRVKNPVGVLLYFTYVRTYIYAQNSSSYFELRMGDGCSTSSYAPNSSAIWSLFCGRWLLLVCYVRSLWVLVVRTLYVRALCTHIVRTRNHQKNTPYWGYFSEKIPPMSSVFRYF